MRHDGREPDALRPLRIRRGAVRSSAGSVMIHAGRTQVLCTASILDAVPEWRAASGKGWLTAEYDMLPGSTSPRKPRSREHVDGRTIEIQRLIGRSLRVAVDLARLGPRTIHVDCDVLQADGGTRTASISGAYVALCDAIRFGVERGYWPQDVRQCAVAAVSVGMVGGRALLDLDYREDSSADVDGNLVMTDQGQWIDVQFTGERATFDEAQFTEMTALGRRGIETLFSIQARSLAEPLPSEENDG